MPTKRMTMRNLRELLRLRLQADLSLRQIKSSLRISLGAVQKITSKADELRLDWAKIQTLNDQQLAHLFYPRSDTYASSTFELPDWVDVHRELRRKGVTKHLLWEEYTQQYPNRSYSYPQYCFLYQQWANKQKGVLEFFPRNGTKTSICLAPIAFPEGGTFRYYAILG